MIGIIGAMDEEIARIKEQMVIQRVNAVGHFVFFEGKLNDVPIVLVKSGIGKVASSITTTLLLSNYRLKQVINVGTCGGINNEMKPLDIFISTSEVYGDVDLTAFGYSYGQMAKCPKSFSPDTKLIEKTIEVCKKLNYSYFVGTIISNDSFSTKKELIDDLISKYFSDIKIGAVDMESAAIAQVCFTFNIKCLVLRTISDIIGQDNQLLSFEDSVKVSSERITKILFELVNVV